MITQKWPKSVWDSYAGTGSVNVLKSFLFNLSSTRLFSRFGSMNLFDCRNPLMTSQFALMVAFSYSPSSAFRALGEIPQKGSGPTKLVDDPCLASKSAFSFPSIPQWPGTQYKFTWFFIANFRSDRMHSHTSLEWQKGEFRALSAAWLSQKMHIFACR